MAVESNKIDFYMMRDGIISQGQGFIELYMQKPGQIIRPITDASIILEIFESFGNFWKAEVYVDIEEDPRLKYVSIVTNYTGKYIKYLKHSPEMLECGILYATKTVGYDDSVDIPSGISDPRTTEFSGDSVEIGMLKGGWEGERKDWAYYDQEDYNPRVSLFKDGPGSNFEYIAYYGQTRKSGEIIERVFESIPRIDSPWWATESWFIEWKLWIKGKGVTSDTIDITPDSDQKYSYRIYTDVGNPREYIWVQSQEVLLDIGTRVVIIRNYTNQPWVISSTLSTTAMRKRTFALDSRNPLCTSLINYDPSANPVNSNQPSSHTMRFTDYHPIPSDTYFLIGHYNDVTVLPDELRERVRNNSDERPEYYGVILAKAQYLPSNLRGGVIVEKTSYVENYPSTVKYRYRIKTHQEEMWAIGQYSQYELGRWVVVSNSDEGNWYIIATSDKYYGIADPGEGLR